MIWHIGDTFKSSNFESNCVCFCFAAIKGSLLVFLKDDLCPSSHRQPVPPAQSRGAGGANGFVIWHLAQVWFLPHLQDSESSCADSASSGRSEVKAWLNAAFALVPGYDEAKNTWVSTQTMPVMSTNTPNGWLLMDDVQAAKLHNMHTRNMLASIFSPPACRSDAQ